MTCIILSAVQTQYIVPILKISNLFISLVLFWWLYGLLSRLVCYKQRYYACDQTTLDNIIFSLALKSMNLGQLWITSGHQTVQTYRYIFHILNCWIFLEIQDDIITAILLYSSAKKTHKSKISLNRLAKEEQQCKPQVIIKHGPCWFTLCGIPVKTNPLAKTLDQSRTTNFNLNEVVTN